MLLDGRSPDAIAAAVQTLKAGELVGLPTETVYGLAADAGSDAAVARIFAAKGRPANHPLIVHVADASGVDHFAANVPDFARRLIDTFWPGPLTLILPRRPGVGAVAAGGVARLCGTGRVWTGRSQRQPIRPCQPDDGGPCAGGHG